MQRRWKGIKSTAHTYFSYPAISFGGNNLHPYLSCHPTAYVRSQNLLRANIPGRRARPVPLHSGFFCLCRHSFCTFRENKVLCKGDGRVSKVPHIRTFPTLPSPLEETIFIHIFHVIRRRMFAHKIFCERTYPVGERDLHHSTVAFSVCAGIVFDTFRENKVLCKGDGRVSKVPHIRTFPTLPSPLVKQPSSISFMSSDGACSLPESSKSEHTQSASETCAIPQWLLLSPNACGIICARSVTIASSCLRHQRLPFPKVESIFLTPAMLASKVARHSASSCSDSV